MGSITGHMNKARLNRCIYWVLYCLKKAGRYTNEYKKQHTNRTGSRDCIDFCTKNPEPMLKYLDKLKNYNTFWYVTITPYSKNIEPNVPSKEKVIESFKKLSLKLNKGFVGWRYDPKLGYRQ